MDDEELLKQADEFLDNARIEDVLAMKLVYTMRVRLEELLADKKPEPYPAIYWPRQGDTYYFVESGKWVMTCYWNGGHDDQCRLTACNVYRTAREAYRALNASKKGPNDA